VATGQLEKKKIFPRKQKTNTGWPTKVATTKGETLNHASVNQGCQIFHRTIYQNGEKLYQMTTILPNYHTNQNARK
jgi:hypothetical protein